MTEILHADIVVGVDTHKHIHAAVAVSALGARLGAMTVAVSEKGYRELEAWARSLGPVRAFGVEGTGSFGAGLSRFLSGQGHTVLEVNRPDRQLRHQHGKSDPVDAEAAARAVLSGQATAVPKSGTGVVEMIRHLKVARDTAVKGRTQAMLTIKSIIVGAPDILREQLEGMRGKMRLLRHLAGLRPGPLTSTMASAEASLALPHIDCYRAASLPQDVCYRAMRAGPGAVGWRGGSAWRQGVNCWRRSEAVSGWDAWGPYAHS